MGIIDYINLYVFGDDGVLVKNNFFFFDVFDENEFEFR